MYLPERNIILNMSAAIAASNRCDDDCVSQSFSETEALSNQKIENKACKSCHTNVDFVER